MFGRVVSVSVLTQMYCNGCSVVLAYCVSHVLVKVSLLIGPDHCCLMLIIFFALVSLYIHVYVPVKVRIPVLFS